MDLSTVVSCVSGPKRPHDKVAVAEMQKDFNACLTNKVGFKGFGIPAEKLSSESVMVYEGESFTLKHGKVIEFDPPPTPTPGFLGLGLRFSSSRY